MNEERRKEIQKAVVMIDNAVNILNEAKDAEQEAFDNLPEGLQQGEKGEKMEGNVSCIEEAIGNLESAQSDLEGIE